MSSYKVEICGVNTAKLPLLTEDERKTCGNASKPAIPRPEKPTSREISAWS